MDEELKEVVGRYKEVIRILKGIRASIENAPIKTERIGNAIVYSKENISFKEYGEQIHALDFVIMLVDKIKRKIIEEGVKLDGDTKDTRPSGHSKEYTQ